LPVREQHIVHDVISMTDN